MLARLGRFVKECCASLAFDMLLLIGGALIWLEETMPKTKGVILSYARILLLKGVDMFKRIEESYIEIYNWGIFLWLLTTALEDMSETERGYDD